jgi:TRAP-type C4-dicarboxylate transport system permease small subunit
MANSTETTPGSPAAGLVQRLGDTLARVCVAIAGVALIGIVAINGVNVVARYIFGSPFSWAEELMLWLMILGVFAGAATVTWRNMHIRIDTFANRGSPLFRRCAYVVSALVCIGVMGAVLSESFKLVSLLQEIDQRSDALRLPIWIPQSFVTGGLALMVLIIAIKLVQTGFGRIEERQP